MAESAWLSFEGGLNDIAILQRLGDSFFVFPSFPSCSTPHNLCLPASKEMTVKTLAKHRIEEKWLQGPHMLKNINLHLKNKRWAILKMDTGHLQTFSKEYIQMLYKHTVKNQVLHWIQIEKTERWIYCKAFHLQAGNSKL